MVIEVTAQTVITAGAVLSALGLLVGLVVKLVHWVDNQEHQDTRIKELEAKHELDMEAMREENRHMMKGILACLKGLQEKGCNGPVTETANELEEYLNAKAHQ